MNKLDILKILKDHFDNNYKDKIFTSPFLINVDNGIDNIEQDSFIVLTKKGKKYIIKIKDYSFK